MSKTIIPEVMAKSFTCPFCNTTAKQEWFYNSHAQPAASFQGSSEQFLGYSSESFRNKLSNRALAEWGFAQCNHCNEITVWHKDTMVFPRQIPVDPPSEDMPEKVSNLYCEAADVLAASPKSAAALLRLALQILLEDVLGQEAQPTIDKNIKLLKEKSVPNKLIQALDVVRVFGNESVHPGVINLDEQTDDAQYLFVLLNLIVEALYTQPKRLGELFEMIPSEKRNASSGDHV